MRPGGQGPRCGERGATACKGSLLSVIGRDWEARGEVRGWVEVAAQPMGQRFRAPMLIRFAEFVCAEIDRAACKENPVMTLGWRPAACYRVPRPMA